MLGLHWQTIVLRFWCIRGCDDLSGVVVGDDAAAECLVGAGGDGWRWTLGQIESRVIDET